MNNEKKIKIISKAKTEKIILNLNKLLESDLSNKIEIREILEETLKLADIDLLNQHKDKMTEIKFYSVIYQVLQGTTIEEIANKMSVKPSTIKYYLQRGICRLFWNNKDKHPIGFEERRRFYEKRIWSKHINLINIWLKQHPNFKLISNK
jgi:hypothetical protein